MRVAIIGAGITGVTLGRMLAQDHEVRLYEGAARIGGLVRCERNAGILFHRVGGHVFNSRNPVVLDWFWQFFDRDREFVRLKRRARIELEGHMVGYPLENHLHELPEKLSERILGELRQIASAPLTEPDNFEDFLRTRFGPTLFEIYFGPYNRKLWHCSLRDIPLDWLDGKLPMPTAATILRDHAARREEDQMVHSSFYYPRCDGSQFVVERLAEGLDIRCDQPVVSCERRGTEWILNGNDTFDVVCYTGDLRRLAGFLRPGSAAATAALQNCLGLRSNGTSNLLCVSGEDHDHTWVYHPDSRKRYHRIIYTGNFSATNNGPDGRLSCVVEFSGRHSEGGMREAVASHPAGLVPVAANYQADSYVVHGPSTRRLVEGCRAILEGLNFHLAGRFAEWEYYNMDKCIESSMRVARRLCGQGRGGFP
jgi:protoporphyrinogen oxidase